MKKRMTKVTAAALAAVLAAGTLLTGCGASTESSSGDEGTEFTWLTNAGVNTIFYDEYEENPAVKYWLSKEWNVDGEDVSISIDFSTPPSGSESDNINTLLATGEYPDILDMNYCSQSVASLYEEGIALDLTDLVAEYMPNYTAWLDEHPAYAAQMTNDGKTLMLYYLSDAAGDYWSSFLYRRDWLVKYGTNPETGEAFTGGYNEDKSEWTDDVVFPSGGTDPVYISDWEWMFGIFETALKEEGITDGYATQAYYTGYYGTGELTSSFGAGFGGYGTYIDESGEAVYTGESEQFRAYLECVNNWYSNGWIDPAFEERSGDTVWFSIDTADVYSGKVGLWYGLSSQVGAGLDSGDAYTSGMCVYAASMPINDVYGSDACKNIEPTCFYGDSLVSTGVIITNKAEDKNLPALLTAIDYMYSKEGGRLRTYGLSDEQMAEAQDEFYLEYGLTNGCYTASDDPEYEYELTPEFLEAKGTDGLEEALVGTRLLGLGTNTGVNKHQTTFEAQLQSQMKKYSPSGNITNLISGRLSADQSDEISVLNNEIYTYLSQEIPNFVTGRKDPTNDDDWNEYCKAMEEYNASYYADVLNKVLAE